MKILRTVPLVAFAAIMLVGCTSKEELLQQRVQSMAASAELGTVVWK